MREPAAFLKEEAKGCGSMSAFVREILDDARALYRLPKLRVKMLEADTKALKLASYRD